MKRKLFASVAFAALVALGGCTQNQHCGDVNGHRVCGNSQLVRISDGRYGMWGPDGIWYWYMLTNAFGSNNHYYYGTGLAVPSGGYWVKAPSPDSATLGGSESLPLDTTGAGGSFTSGIATDVEESVGGSSYSSGGSSNGDSSGGSSYSSGGSSDDESSSGGSSYSSGGSSSDDSSGGSSYSSGGDSGSSDPGGSSSDSGSSYSSGGDSGSSDGGSYSSGDPG